MSDIDTIREALQAASLLMRMNANSYEFYERRAQFRPHIDNALAALDRLQAQQPKTSAETLDKVMAQYSREASLAGAYSALREQRFRDSITHLFIGVEAGNETQAQQPNAEPVDMIHNDYDASVKCSNCGTDGGFGVYDDLDWAKFCPGCGRPIARQIDAKGNVTPHPLYAHPPASTEPRLTVEQAMEVVKEWCFDWCERVAPDQNDWANLNKCLTKAAKP